MCNKAVSAVAAAAAGALLVVTLAALLVRVVAAGRRAKSLRDEPIEGEIGVAATALLPAGLVSVRGSVYQACSAAPVAAGARVVVVAGGTPLRVKPL